MFVLRIACCLFFSAQLMAQGPNLIMPKQLQRPAAKAQNNQATLKMGLLKYKGGGDWYANPTALPNLASFCKQKLYSNFELDYATVDVASAEIFDYAFLHMTGHGNVVFSDAEAENLRTYLISGGFLHIDDNYGMDPFIRPAMKKVFPELDFVELPYDHPIYNMNYKFKLVSFILNIKHRLKTGIKITLLA